MSTATRYYNTATPNFARGPQHAQRRIHEHVHTQQSVQEFLAHDNKRSPSVSLNNLHVAEQKQNVLTQTDR